MAKSPRDLLHVPENVLSNHLRNATTTDRKYIRRSCLADAKKFELDPWQEWIAQTGRRRRRRRYHKDMGSGESSSRRVWLRRRTPSSGCRASGLPGDPTQPRTWLSTLLQTWRDRINGCQGALETSSCSHALYLYYQRHTSRCALKVTELHQRVVPNPEVLSLNPVLIPLERKCIRTGFRESTHTHMYSINYFETHFFICRQCTF